jgi:predicted ester cyclase
VSLSSGDRVAIRWSAGGVHAGNLLGVPATGRRVDITGIDIFRVKDGKLAEMWQNWDQLGRSPGSHRRSLQRALPRLQRGYRQT